VSNEQQPDIQMLLNLFENAKPTAHACPQSYCSTCGGKAAVIREALIKVDKSIMLKALSDPTSFELHQTDFNFYPNRLPYTCVLNISPKVEFLIDCFRKLSIEQKSRLITQWIQNCDTWPLWIFDGVSYYFVSEYKQSLREKWIEKIKEKMNHSENASLIETYNLKFK